MKEKDYQAIINLYTDKYSNNGSQFPLTLEQTNNIVELVKQHMSIISRYSNNRQKLLEIYAKSVAVRGIVQYLKMPTFQAALLYDIIKQWLS